MKYLLIALLVGMTLASHAQFHKSSMTMPTITRSLGVSFQKFDGLNGRVANFSQYEQLRNYTATIGLGWLKEYKRVVSGGGLTLASSLSGDRDKKSSAIRSAGVNFDIGYDVIKKESVLLYPMVGLGLQGYQAIFYKDNSGVPFDDVLESPTVQNNIQALKLTNQFVTYRLGVGLALRSPKNPGNSIGLQAGYAGSFKGRTWRSSDNQLLGNAPSDNLEQVYASLVLTCAPWHKKK